MVDRKGRRPRYSGQDRDEIRYLRAQGMAHHAIGRRLGCSEHTIARQVSEHGLDVPPEPQEFAWLALHHRLRALGRRLASPTLRAADEAILSEALAKTAEALDRIARKDKRKAKAMADAPKKLRLEDMDEDELRARLVKLVLGLETKGGSGDGGPDDELGGGGEPGEGPLPGDGAGEPEAP